MSVCVCILVHGSDNYFLAARQAILSILDNSDFDIFVGIVGERARLPQHSRVRYASLTGEATRSSRPERFLLKFDALQACLDSGQHDYIVLIDADVALARPLTKTLLVSALGKAGLAMVEQTTIRGSDFDRRVFLAHYERYALPVILPSAPKLTLSDFRHYNSGVVIGTRSAWTTTVSWARQCIAKNTGKHEVGDHMVADQDYFLVWANSLHPEMCKELPWFWNHCEHWDRWFPRPGVLFAHFSNFCEGPRRRTPRRMRSLRRKPRVYLNQIAAALLQTRED